MPDLHTYFRTAPVSGFEGTVYRICPARFGRSAVAMRGSFLHGARYNTRGYFGVLYTSLSQETAHREIARYFTVPPIGGFVQASILLRLGRVVDLTNRQTLNQARISREQLVDHSFTVTQEIGNRAWESGIEALLVPSAANHQEHNLAVFLDNHYPKWKIELTDLISVDTNESDQWIAKSRPGAEKPSIPPESPAPRPQERYTAYP